MRVSAVAALGEGAAFDLERVLADIDACDNALEFRVLYDNDLVELSEHRWAVRFGGECRMELVSGHKRPQLTGTGATNWCKVVRLRIEKVGGSND